MYSGHHFNQSTDSGHQAYACTRAGPGFFLGGVPPLRNGLTHIELNTFYKPIQRRLYRVGGGVADPRHPPPGSTPDVG